MTKPKAKPAAARKPVPKKKRGASLAIKVLGLALVLYVGATATYGVILIARFQGQSQTTSEFTTFERRIRSEVWGEAAVKVRHGDFKDTRAALAWMQQRWPKVEGEAFLPLDEQEQACGQDLDKLADLWEAWSK